MEKRLSTEKVLAEDIRRVQTACISNQILHLSRSFTSSPGHSAVVTTYVTCPDDIARDLHARLDATVRAFFAEHNFAFEDAANIQ
jgi:hypothetical protein